MPQMPPRVRCARVYEAPQDGEGVRVLVDRLWPRGMRRGSFAYDEWLKDVAPSSGLRTWYRHDPDRFPEFRRRYRAELREPQAARALDRLREMARHGPLTLLTAGKELRLSHLRVLAELLADEGGTAAEGGDPACWAARVCPECGRLCEQDPPTRCPACGAEIPAG